MYNSRPQIWIYIFIYTCLCEHIYPLYKRVENLKKIVTHVIIFSSLYTQLNHLKATRLWIENSPFVAILILI